MRRAAVTRPRASPTRDRILEAAVRRFARQSYEETGLRDIAADASVDVAYVHRSFGSKEMLFAEAVRASTGIDRLLADEKQDMSGHLAGQAFRGDDQASEETGPLDVIIHSLSSPAASRVVRERIVGDFVEPLGARLDDPSLLRAAVIGALLAGIGIFRNVLEIEPLREAAGGNLETLLATTIAHIGTVPLGAKQITPESQDQ